MKVESGIRIETRSLAEQVYTNLCNQIIEGAISYGEGLNIKAIAREFNVSSMPVREAIKRLEMEGVVTIKPRSTCLVRVPTKSSILNALEMRELIETHCVETAYPRVSRARLENLESIIREMGKILDTGKGPAMVRNYVILDRRYHTELCRLADNNFIDKFYREVSLHLNMKFIYDIAIPPDLSGTFRAHSRLVESLAENSPEAAAIIREHLAISRQNVLRGSLFSALDGQSSGAA